jgi:protein-L-isoaspartate(D-aspartate) O-methyltransferase
MKPRPILPVALIVLATAGVRTALSAPFITFSATEARKRMVDEEIVAAGIKNPRVIDAMRATPRHEFVGFRERSQAYFDMALPIGEGQTISPPFIVAYMTEQLDPQPTDKVLEIGTGSGYQASVLSPLVKEVYTIEIKEPLGRQAAHVIKKLGYPNVFPKIGDGFQGWPEHAPFDKIIVTCSPENVPQALVDQLREGGRLLIPLGQRYQQTLYLFQKHEGKLVSEKLYPVLFVPMTGTAESLRKVQPDALHPAVLNGSFEEVTTEGQAGIPKGWYYVRQAKVIEDRLAPDGQRYLEFTNNEPGRGSQALQGFPVDGHKIDALDVSVMVKGENIRPGQIPQQLPMLAILFYDDKQNTVGERAIGPWSGTFDWQLEKGRLKVPPKTTHAILRIGLLGATGEVSLDAVKMEVAK